MTMEDKQNCVNHNCDLCELKQITKWYRNSDTFAVLDCVNCNVPMIVLKRHTTQITKNEYDILQNLLFDLESYEGISGIHDYEMRSIPHHWHMHIR